VAKKQPTTFGSRLRALREKAGLSLEQLAQRAGMHKFGVAKLERGDREPSWASVQALARALGVKCDEFMDGEADEGNTPGRPAAVAQGKRSADASTPESAGQKKPARGKGSERKGKTP
jgi:transcriptional regulator with XRE-family HTH domain